MRYAFAGRACPTARTRNLVRGVADAARALALVHAKVSRARASDAERVPRGVLPFPITPARITLGPSLDRSPTPGSAHSTCADADDRALGGPIVHMPGHIGLVLGEYEFAVDGE